MATQSEDTIALSTHEDSDSEAEDTTADYPSFPTSTPGLPRLDPFNFPATPEDVPTYLSSLSQAHATGSALPKRGLKDFEPDPTQLQARTLEASRQAMNDALLHTRVHGPKTGIVGVFDERTGETRVKRRKGNWLASVGRDLAGGGVVLRREEALWALERGSLDVRFRAGAYTSSESSDYEADEINAQAGQQRANINEIEEGETNDHDECNGLPMSLQAAYTALIDPEEDAPGGRLTMEEYIVYGGLKRAGFIVLRARGTDRLKSLAVEMSKQQGYWRPKEFEIARTHEHIGLINWLISLPTFASSRARSEQSRLSQGPLVKPGLYRSYQGIYPSIALNDATSFAPKSVDIPKPVGKDRSPYSTTYHIYKARPSRPFKKRDPGAPDFSISVVNARTTRLPTLPELEALLNEQTLDVTNVTSIERKNNRNMGQTYKALKQGARNVLLAIVDEGLVSYIRVADSVFTQEGRLFEREAFTGVGGVKEHGKSRGSGKGRGKGRRA